MKVSVVTICFNSAKTIEFTLNSVITQKYKNIEHVIVDGGSSDGTIGILKNYENINKKIIYASNKKLYESLNIGIKKSSGDLISILHSDDIYNNTNIISQVVNIAKREREREIFIGNVLYFKNKEFLNIKRNYRVKSLSKTNFLIGDMPPHTGTFYKKEIFKKYGYYDEGYKISADFDHMINLFIINRLNYKCLNFVTTRMRMGGISGKNIDSFILINKEILHSLKKRGLKASFLKILLRIPGKIFQYISLNKKKNNKKYELILHKSFRNLYENQINIILNIKKFDFSKNFILSALNLAFLGSFSKDLIKLDPDLINWPDGIFSKIYNNKIKKIPGRKLLDDLKIDRGVIKKILVIGNLSKRGENYLKRKYKLPILIKKLPFGRVEYIISKIDFNINKNQLVFITLPTPKQEQIAAYLKKENKNFKIICIGGSINIASGEEKPVPNFLNNLEFLWRLRYETSRRIVRLLKTSISFALDFIFYKKINKTKLFIVDNNKMLN